MREQDIDKTANSVYTISIPYAFYEKKEKNIGKKRIFGKVGFLKIFPLLL